MSYFDKDRSHFPMVAATRLEIHKDHSQTIITDSNLPIYHIHLQQSLFGLNILFTIGSKSAPTIMEIKKTLTNIKYYDHEFNFKLDLKKEYFIFERKKYLWEHDKLTCDGKTVCWYEKEIDEDREYLYIEKQ
ncbi:hypothetical protein HDV06_003153, partial [Boothiomyces sp. JEL0866]